jgi:putative CocE/NonD family hydrolase
MLKTCWFLCCWLPLLALAQKESNYVKEHYNKKDTLIRMRDGVGLYTIIYSPKDNSNAYPILMERTPYSVAPYGDTNYRRQIGPNPTLMKEQYIFVYQDVRGRYMSEGNFTEMTPHIPKKKSKKDVDESSDTYDTVDWLLKNIPNNNGKVGLYGISYPGFYASACLPDPHPAIRAVSPQAPVTDEFIGDDVNHNGAFFLLDNFSFTNYFGKARKGPVKDYGNDMFPVKSKDMYDYFLKMGTIRETESAAYFNRQAPIWTEYITHDTYDAYWQARNISNHLKAVSIPVLVVGGWYDAEDLYGSLQSYRSLETNPQNQTQIALGPWTHGAWESTEWKYFGTHDFNGNTSVYFQDSVEAPFFNYYLKQKGAIPQTEATVYETGSNRWLQLPAWPPASVQYQDYYLGSNQQLLLSPDRTGAAFDEYSSHPNKPVPYTNGIYARRNNEYLVEDQRFAATRPDVLVYETGILTEDVHIAGNIRADLRVSMTGSDADFVVKLIDVLPENERNFKNAPRGFQMAGFQRLVRAEVMRGKFRDSYTDPKPFQPGEVTPVKIQLNDVAHTFLKGHRIMVQIQSSWFPLVDRNPQQFMRIPEATPADFQSNNIRIHHTEIQASKISLPVWKP